MRIFAGCGWCCFWLVCPSQMACSSAAWSSYI